MSDKRLNDMLAKWPAAPRSQLEWDAAAERIAGALKTPPQRDAASMSDDALLAPPLPKLPDEGQTAIPLSRLEPAARPGSLAPGLAVENKMKERRDRTSFQELTKLASTPPPPNTTGAPTPAPTAATPGVLRAEEAASTDSGIVDLKAIATADPSGAHRAQSTPLASEGLFDEDHAQAAPAATTAASSSSAPAAPASSDPAAAAPQATSAKKSAKDASEKKGGGVVIVLGTLAAVGAIAAGAFFFVKWQHSHHDATATTSVATPADNAGQAKPSTAPTAAVSVARTDDNEIDLTNAAPGTKPVVHPKRIVPGGARPSMASIEAPAPPTSVDPNLVAKVPTGPAGGSGDLATAMKAAAGGGTGLGQGDTEQGPKFAPGSVPQRPAQGQVQGAIGQVMQSVKACLGSEDPVSHANVVFQSDGTVKSVTVSGFAAGKPQEACIKSALSKAKVDPFAEATYSVPVSIRP